MKLLVSVKDRVFSIEVGPGTQSVQWLANCAVARFDPSFMQDIGVPIGVRIEDGSTLDLSLPLVERLKDGDRVFVMLSKEAAQGDEEEKNEEEQDNQTADEDSLNNIIDDIQE